MYWNASGDETVTPEAGGIFTTPTIETPLPLGAFETDGVGCGFGVVGVWLTGGVELAGTLNGAEITGPVGRELGTPVPVGP
jgi:hypothetical protein